MVKADPDLVYNTTTGYDKTAFVDDPGSKIVIWRGGKRRVERIKYRKKMSCKHLEIPVSSRWWSKQLTIASRFTTTESSADLYMPESRFLNRINYNRRKMNLMTTSIPRNSLKLHRDAKQIQSLQTVD